MKLRPQTKVDGEVEGNGRDDREALAPPAVEHMLRLQRQIGNHAVARMLARAPAAPYAKTSVQAELSQALKDEGTRIANAKVIVAFIRAKRGTAGGATGALDPADLLADAATAKKLTPKPKTTADLQPTLDLLVFHDVLVPTGTTFSVKIDTKTNDVDTARFEKAVGAIAAATADFERRAAKKDSVDPVGMTGLLDISIAAGSAGEKKADRDAQAAVTAIEGKLKQHVAILAPDPAGKPRSPITGVTVATPPPSAPNAKAVQVVALPVAGRPKPVEVPADQIVRIESVESGSDPATVKLRESLGKALDKARKQLARAQGYRTFAVEVVDFLERLNKRNSRWVGGTYPSHDWGEFSVDAFLSVGEDKDGFYSRPGTETFFDDLNATALEDKPTAPYGPFQWRAVYNDDKIIATVGKKFGANRISKAPHHGPAPDKLHVHLDLRPVTFQPDATTGFTIGPGGRIEPF